MVSHLTITASNTGAAAPKRQGSIRMSIMIAGVDRALKNMDAAATVRDHITARIGWSPSALSRRAA